MMIRVLLDYLAIGGIIFALNLLPAFGPPIAAVGDEAC
jgi:hypothetical protein